ncbi:hypothetical protein HT094_01085 [Shewanella sp. ZOR0012]|nr:hypothetical protein [Shewanella sp. ZOR0012]
MAATASTQPVAAYQHLAQGQTETLTIPITVTDSTGATSTANLTITLTGTNDGATISGRRHRPSD